MNKLIIIGNLTNTPELRSTKDGISVCSFTVAVNRTPTQAQRQKGERPEADFFNVTAWRERGELCAKFLEKGKKVCVTGRVSVRTWETETKHGANLEVLAEEVEFLSPRVSDTANPTPSDPVDRATGFNVVETDDLPF